MRNFWKVIVSAVLCLFMVMPVFADEPGQRPDYYTDYYMIVESPEGGINIYSEARMDATKLNNDLIPNGTALHIEGETQEGERTWGYVEYHGMKGYVPLDNCKPSTVAEAVESEILLEGANDVDYDIEVNSEEGAISIYRGPGEKFGKETKTDEIANGEKLHISKEIEMEDKSRWGLTEIEGTEGWVNLEDTKQWKDKENASDMVSMEKDNAEVSVTPTPTVKEEVTPTVEPTATSTVTPTATSTVTPTVEPTATPTVEPTATPTVEPTATDKPEPTPESTSEIEEKNEKEASSQDVKTSSGWTSNPFVWIGIISCIAVVGLLVYHFKKK